MNQNPKIAFKKSPQQTLEAMQIGESTLFKMSDLKLSGMKSAASRLKKRGLLYKITEAGRIDDYEVTRLS